MPKNTQGGKKYKQQKHKQNEQEQRSLEKPTDGQEYAIVTKLLGNSRVSARFYDTRDPNDKRMNEIICFLRPRLKKKRQFAKIGSIMIISLRDFEKDKGDVLYIYNQDEMNRIKRKRLIHENLVPKDLEDDESFNFQEEKEAETDEEEEEGKIIERKPITRNPNISVQDFGLPPIEDDNQSSDNIENI